MILAIKQDMINEKGRIPKGGSYELYKLLIEGDKDKATLYQKTQRKRILLPPKIS